MIPYSRQKIDQDDINAVVKVLQSDFLTQGPNINSLEEALAKYCGAKYAVIVPNGTVALHVAYIAAGMKAGDEMITSANTFAATTNMALVLGATPVFCDIRKDTYNIDESQIEKHITKKTKFLVPVHFAGQPCDMDKIFKIARKHKLKVIEDGAHALGAKYKGKKIGSLSSEMTIFSFHPVKPITMGEGGVVLTNNKKYYERMKRLCTHGIHKNAKGQNVMTELGFNYRVTDFQAALGLSQMKKLDKFIRQRRRVVKWYKQELQDVKDIILPVELKGNYSGWHLYVIRLVDASKRYELANYLRSKGIGVNFHYPAVYGHPYYRQNGYKNTQCKNADAYEKSCLVIPCHQQLKQKDVKMISREIKKFFS